MAKQPQDMVIPMLREIQAGLATQGKDIAAMRAELRRQGVKVDELLESSTMALGLAGHANVRHESVQKQLDDLTQRIERLEKAK